ncbi:MAG: MOSC domain-containing protein YiiM, partial [Polaribacter sp.]
MKIVSTNIGERRVIDWKGELVTTGSFKFPVEKPIFLDSNDVKGDEISDRENHGGMLQAIYGYSIKHYDFFKPSYPDLDWQFGMFGENLTMDDLDETT